MEATFAYVVWFLCVCSLGNVFPVDCAHFMGGIIRWRPVNPATFDGTVRIGLSEQQSRCYIPSACYESPLLLSMVICMHDIVARLIWPL